MEWDQLLFKKSYDLVQRVFHPNKHRIEPDAVFLDTESKRLSALARLLTGKAILIKKAEKEGGYSGNIFFLPAYFDHFKNTTDNLDYYIYRVCYLSVQRKLNFNWKDAIEHDLDSSRKKAEETYPIILEEMFREYPGIRELAEKVIQLETDYAKRKEIPLYYLFGRWMHPNTSMVSGDVSGPADKTLDSKEITTEAEAKPIEYKKTIEVNKKDIENYTLNHNFEKVDTLEEFKGNWRDLDGTDELEIHEDALKEVNLRDTVRVDDPVHSVYASDFLGLTVAGESKEKTAKEYLLKYREWNYKKKIYKEDFCKVSHTKSDTRPDEYYKQALLKNAVAFKQLKRMFLKTWNELEKIKKLNNGEEIDIDRVVENYADKKAGKTPSENIYISSRKKKKDISILILMDLSLSTDSFAMGKRIMDVEKESIILFSELLDEFRVDFQIDCFYSRTRNYCDYITVKDFKDHWKDRRAYLGGLEPIGYTRIGPAIRHASSLLQKHPSENKWILLLSDAKPNDYDRYEGRYGVEDIKQSAREAHKSNIGLYTLSISKSDHSLLPEMFGHRYKVLSNPILLPDAMADFYLEILKA